MSTFVPNRALLNSKFNGYKLDSLDQEITTKRYKLPLRVTQSIATAGRVPLTFHEVQSRITQNHLAVSRNGQSVYVDAEMTVMLIQIDTNTLVPLITQLYQLPVSITSRSAERSDLNPEYPSATFINDDLIFVADGQGCLYVLNISNTAQARVMSVHSLPESTTLPFKLHAAACLASSPGAVTVIISTAHIRDIGKPKKIDFDIWAAEVPLTINTVEALQPLRILWRRRGQDVPVTCTFDDSRQAFMLIGASEYLDVNEQVLGNDTKVYQPSAEEMAPIPRVGENLDSEELSTKPPAYSWTQSSDSVTIAFALPSNTQKSNIRVSYSPNTLTALVVDVEAGPTPKDPNYLMQKLWETIIPSSCFWTWDRDAEHSYGVLTIHLDKKHEGTRWIRVFADSTDIDIPETMDPSELYTIRESMEKWTSSLQDSGLTGQGSTLPSIAEGELDDEVDASVGRLSCMTWVGDKAQSLNLSAPNFWLLSTELPGINSSEPTIIIKHTIDGTLYTLNKAQKKSDLPEWAHTETFSALAFVLATKLDRRYTFHVPSKAVLAFDSGSVSRGSNLYIYRSATNSSDNNWAKQAVINISNGTSGSLLGVAAVPITDGYALLCLCETDLVMIQCIL